MHSTEEKGLVIAKLEDGEDLFGAIEKLVGRHSIRSALVLSGIGQLRDYTLGYYTGDEYLRRTFEEPAELLALQGSVTTEREVVAHVHAVLGDAESNTLGGHLFSATVATLNELVIRKLETVRLGRVLNPETGLKELVIR
jgi:predicted DNA-binding protein with PD1-like motif